jgi:putative glycosyltransferase (TIGR04372 family)
MRIPRKILHLLFSNSPEYWDFEAERAYLRQGTPSTLTFVAKSHHMKSERSINEMEGNVKFFGAEWASVFGHITGLSLYPKMEKVGWITETKKVLFYRKTANSELLSHYASYYGLCNASDSQASSIDIALRNHYVPMNSFTIPHGQTLDLYSAQNNIEYEFAKQFPNSTFLQLRSDVKERALISLLESGFNPESWFVTLHMREARSTSPFRGGDNVQVSDYLPAIYSILEAGGSIIRIGDPSMTPLAQLGLRHKNFFDLIEPTPHIKSVHVFAMSKCRFFLGTQSGPTTIPNEFGVPIVYTNVVAFGRAHRYRGFMLPTLIKDSNGKIITLEAGLQNPLAWNVRKNFQDFTRMKNSPQDIKEATELAIRLTAEKHDRRSTLDFRVMEDLDGQFTRGKLPLHMPISNDFCEKYHLLK